MIYRQKKAMSIRLNHPGHPVFHSPIHSKPPEKNNDYLF